MVMQVWPMESISGRVNELDKGVLGHPSDHIIGVFFGDVYIEILHFG